MITNDIYMCNMHFRVAHTSYGKTEMFHLPLIALASKKNCKHVSFVFVPYTVILADSMRRLKTENLFCSCMNHKQKLWPFETSSGWWSVWRRSGSWISKLLGFTVKINVLEKANRADSFIRDQKKSVLLKTKLATEGIDVRELKMVIMVDYKPTIIEFIQAGGRLRTSGMLYVLLDPKTDFKREKSDIAPIDFTCPSTQISKFHGLPLCDTDLRHLQCCGSTNFLLTATEQLVLSVAKVATKTAYETKKDRDDHLTNNKRKAPDLPFFFMEKRRMPDFSIEMATIQIFSIRDMERRWLSVCNTMASVLISGHRAL